MYKIVGELMWVGSSLGWDKTLYIHFYYELLSTLLLNTKKNAFKKQDFLLLTNDFFIPFFHSDLR